MARCADAHRRHRRGLDRDHAAGACVARRAARAVLGHRRHRPARAVGRRLPGSRAARRGVGGLRPPAAAARRERARRELHRGADPRAAPDLARRAGPRARPEPVGGAARLAARDEHPHALRQRRPPAAGGLGHRPRLPRRSAGAAGPADRPRGNDPGCGRAPGGAALRARRALAQPLSRVARARAATSRRRRASATSRARNARRCSTRGRSRIRSSGQASMRARSASASRTSRRCTPRSPRRPRSAARTPCTKPETA